MNEYDSSTIQALMAEFEDGYQLTTDPSCADIIVLNTCSIREKAQEKVFSDLGRLREFKNRNNAIIVVAGCVASQEGEAIVKRAPYVDIVVGPQTLQRIPELIRQRRGSKKSQVDISFPTIEKFDNLPKQPINNSISAFVTIMEGCSKYCSYCVVPYTRGEEVSRPVTDVLREIVAATKQGAREIVLLGQNVNAYCSTLEDGTDIDFATLLEYVHQIPQVLRIRFITSHPTEMSERLIACYANLPKLASQLHLPVQSGSDKILMAMKRGYTVLEYKSIVRKLLRNRPHLSLSSDFIVGFPNETDQDFAATLQLVTEISFDNSFSFVFSPRPGTPAANIHDHTAAAIKAQRLQLLQTRLTQSAQHISSLMLGSKQQVLVEGYAKDGIQLSGRTDNYKTVNFAGGAELIGQMVTVQIDNCLANSLQATLCQYSNHTEQSA